MGGNVAENLSNQSVPEAAARVAAVVNRLVNRIGSNAESRERLAEIEIPEELRDNLALFLRLERRVLSEYDPEIADLFDKILTAEIVVNAGNPGTCAADEAVDEQGVPTADEPTAVAFREVVDLIDSLPLDKQQVIVRAFTSFFHLANLSEENYRVAQLREREAGASTDTEVDPANELTVAYHQLENELGVEGANELLDKLEFHPVFTAPPTEARRKAVEGKIRYEQAFRGIEELRQNVDSRLIINNENILEIYGRLSLKQAFGKADDILCSAAKGIAEIITVESDLVNVDFADVSKVMRDSGRAHMAVATAEGDNRAETAAEASLRSPLLDHSLISGAKNILLNISVSNADSLMYEEVVRILEYIQAHASVQDDNGVIHNANIIWGTSEKPQLGNAIELVVVATGFSGDASVDVMKQIIPPARITEPVKEPVAPVLEPIKPVAPPQRPPEQVMLGAKSTRYNNIELLLAKPAYQSRNSKFIVQMPGGRKEVLREESENSQQAANSQSGSLFD